MCLSHLAVCCEAGALQVNVTVIVHSQMFLCDEGVGGQLGVVTYVRAMCWPQTSANNELCLPGVTPDSRPLFNENKSLWISSVIRWRWRLVRLPEVCFPCFPQIWDLLIGTYCAHQILHGFTVSWGGWGYFSEQKTWVFVLDFPSPFLQSG